MNQPMQKPAALDSLDAIMQARQTALDEVRKAQAAIQKAKQALAALNLSVDLKLMHSHKDVSHAPAQDDALARDLDLDREIWLTLHQHLFAQVQTSNQREAQQTAIYQGDYPAVNKTSVLETLKAYQEGAEDAFVQSVYDFWSKLNPRYASNDAAKFEAKQVLSFACEPSGKECYITRRGEGVLADLTQLVKMYQAQDMPFDLVNIPEAWTYKRYAHGSWVDFGAFKIKLFKKGTMHIMINDDVRVVLNKTLATAAGKKLHHTQR